MTRQVLDAKEIERAIVRVSHEIVERNKGVGDVCVMGIQKGGVHLAARIAGKLSEIEGGEVPVGTLDISFYRDDIMIRERPTVSPTEVDFDINGKTVVLVDDVLFTGRSIRAAMDGIMDMGRPRSIQLAVLIDRGHRELPIKADYAGKNIPTARDETIEVLLTEDGHPQESVLLKEAADGS
jgi:pyrimidine operon attenuation protein/uracil phosphoribosyltransferase